MMVVRRFRGSSDSGSELEHRHIADLTEYLESGDLIVVNDTRVIPARVFGHRTDTGGRVELLLLEEIERTVGNDGTGRTAGLGQRNEEEVKDDGQRSAVSAVWEALYRAGGHPAVGQSLSLADGKLKAEITGLGQEGKVSVRVSSDSPLLDVLEEEGLPPLPPYIKRPSFVPRSGMPCGKPPDLMCAVEVDRDRYQTVYAAAPGAVAAPTAGLHFTRELLQDMERHGVRTTAVTLHVGHGTFKPVRTELARDHVMDSERYIVGEEAVEAINSSRRRGGRIVAIGTTTARTLETVMSEHGVIIPCSGRSSLFICPPYSFNIVDAILTNFHLPKSSLLMMICAFAGINVVLRAYKEAVKQRYRFYSYGDCVLIL